MLKPEPMTGITIYCLKRENDEIVRALGYSGILHQTKRGSLGNLLVEDRIERLEHQKNLIGLERWFSQRVTGQSETPHVIFDGSDEVYSNRYWFELHLTLGKIAARKRELLIVLQRLRLLSSLNSELPVGEWSEKFKTQPLFAVCPTPVCTSICADLVHFPQLHHCRSSLKETGILIIVRDKDIDKIKNIIDSHHGKIFHVSRVPHFSKEHLDLKIKCLKKNTLKRLLMLRKKQQSLVVQHAAAYKAAHYQSEVNLKVTGFQQQMGQVGSVARIDGWLRKSDKVQLIESLDAHWKGRYFVVWQPVKVGITPVSMKNRSVFSPFEILMKIYGTPSYHEHEPTPLTAIFFVLLFGMMFGDVGHGLLLVLGGFLLSRYSDFIDQGKIISLVGCSATIFGFLFGSIFGFESIFTPVLFSPLHRIDLLMELALTVGFIMIIIAQIAGFASPLQKGIGYFITSARGVAGFVFIAAIFPLALLAHHDLIPVEYVVYSVLPLPFVVIAPFFKSETEDESIPRIVTGLLEGFELVLATVVNLFSFIRVAAFGLAHVGLFYAMFALVEAVEPLPLSWLWIALIHIVGNILIIVVEGLVVSIQALRLDFYEFLSRFCQGNGVPFTPFTLPKVKGG